MASVRQEGTYLAPPWQGSLLSPRACTTVEAGHTGDSGGCGPVGYAAAGFTG